MWIVKLIIYPDVLKYKKISYSCFNFGLIIKYL